MGSKLGHCLQWTLHRVMVQIAIHDVGLQISTASGTHMICQKVVVVAYNESGVRIGETHHNARISDAMVDQIRELHEDYGRSYRTIAEQLHIAFTTVRKICAYQRRAQTPVRWRRVKVAIPVA